MFALTCGFCGEHFYARFKNQKYCSYECKYSVGRALYTCAYCGKEIIGRASKVQMYCSIKCAGAGHLVIKQCPVCLEYFNPSRTGGVNCSMECKRIAQSTQRRGSNNPNWKGGIDCYGSDWSTVSRKVLERDDFTCQKCQARGVHLEAHHIIPAAFYRNPTKANRALNLITLCRRCHNGLRQLGKAAVPEMLKLRKAYQTKDW